ncbi:MAG: tetratricopeptide repeat protein [bacterium]
MQGKIIQKDLTKCNAEDYSEYYDLLDYAVDGLESLEESYDEQANFMNGPTSFLTGAVRYKSAYQDELQEAQDTLTKSQDSFEAEDHDLALHLLQKAEDHIVTSRLYWNLFTGEAGGDNTGDVVERQSKKFFLAAVEGKVYDEYPVTAETIFEMEARETGDWKRHDDVSAEWEELITYIKDQVNTEKEGRSYSETDKVALAIQLFQEQQYGLYSSGQNSLTHMLSERGGNCVARALSMVCFFESMSFWFPKGIELGVQVYQDHIVPVLYNTETNRVWDLWSGEGLEDFHNEESIQEPAIPIYKPQYFYYTYLVKKHRLSDYNMERLHLAGPLPDDIVLEETHITGTGDSMFKFTGGSTVYSEEGPPEYSYKENDYADTLIMGSRELALQPPSYIIHYNDGSITTLSALCSDHDNSLYYSGQQPRIANSLINVSNLDSKELDNLLFECRCYGRHEEAIAILKIMISNSPDHAPYYNTLGCVYDDFGQHNLAIDQYNKTLALDPNSPFAYSNLARAYTGLGKYDMALERYQYVLANFPDYSVKANIQNKVEHIENSISDQTP